MIATFFTKAFYIKYSHRGDRIARRRAFSENASYYCGQMLKAFNIEVSVKGAPIAGTNFLYVGNHMGFVDIFVLASVLPGLYITSQEMRETPLLGAICEMAGCIFVERRSRKKILSELNVLKDALDQGFNIVLYPEATSTDGEKVYPFKKTLMMAGPHAGKPIQPGCINFLEIGGKEYTLKNRDNVCWYGEMSFITAMWNILTTSSVKVELSYLEPIHEHKDTDRGVVAAKAHALISAHYRPPRAVTEMQAELSEADKA